MKEKKGKLAQYIIRQGGVDFVLPIYKQRVAELRARFSKGPSMERFVEKFAALFVTTAEIASQALKLSFDIEGLMAFMEEYDREHGAERNTSAASYDLIIRICRSQSHKFYVCYDKSLPRTRLSGQEPTAPTHECWGRITNMAKEHSDGRLIVQEFEIRKTDEKIPPCGSRDGHRTGGRGVLREGCRQIVGMPTGHRLMG